jgi:hypothetical protein
MQTGCQWVAAGPWCDRVVMWNVGGRVVRNRPGRGAVAYTALRPGNCRVERENIRRTDDGRSMR